ncbi:hypothetical protein BKA65DRAFT_478435 [Rhexocercosporidium sp. MPI-PUGE-AT-0058]|nr:hypothetical protein BKA65DRAFT_478435 [Rhexocercosporidium sp. MPI-PUGE-AT-0058]
MPLLGSSFCPCNNCTGRNRRPRVAPGPRSTTTTPAQAQLSQPPPPYQPTTLREPTDSVSAYEHLPPYVDIPLFLCIFDELNHCGKLINDEGGACGGCTSIVVLELVEDPAIFGMHVQLRRSAHSLVAMIANAFGSDTKARPLRLETGVLREKLKPCTVPVESDIPCNLLDEDSKVSREMKSLKGRGVDYLRHWEVIGRARRMRRIGAITENSCKGVNIEKRLVEQDECDALEQRPTYSSKQARFVSANTLNMKLSTIAATALLVTPNLACLEWRGQLTWVPFLGYSGVDGVVIDNGLEVCNSRWGWRIDNDGHPQFDCLPGYIYATDGVTSWYRNNGGGAWALRNAAWNPSQSVWQWNTNAFGC